MVVGVALVILVRDFAAIWFVAVGWFLFEAASVSAVQEAFAKRIDGLSVGDVMRRTDMAIDGDSTVAAALELHGWGEKLRPLPVAVAGRVLGVFGTREAQAVPVDERADRLIRDAMKLIGPDDVIGVDVPLRRALARDAGTAGILVVVEHGAVVGLLTGEELADIFASLRQGRRRR
jgi:hypothetical protein